MGAVVSAVVVLLYGIFRGGWLDALLAGIAVGMSMLPEEFPVVLTVFMAMGAWRISQVRVLTRRASAIETLGAATVLCTDKTGTLTENRMTIGELRLPEGSTFRVGAMENTRMPQPFRDLALLGVLASAPEPFDPMEKAFHALSESELTVAPGAGTDLGPDLRTQPRSAGHDPGVERPQARASGGRERRARGHCRIVPPRCSGSRCRNAGRR